MTTIQNVGAGTMGRGIAQAAATAGFEVSLHDASEEELRRAVDGIRGRLEGAVQKGRSTAEERDAILLRIRPVPGLEAAVGEADLAVEAVPESLDLKIQVFRAMHRAAPPEALLATNTSSLSVGKIAETTGRPDKVLGMHFFNPVPVMALVEIIRAERTSEESVTAAVEVARRMGKEPIVVRDAPGFATSRLGVLLGLEAMRMLEQGVASAEDIDKAMTLGYRHPMGPLRLTDLVGLDVRLAIADYLHRELDSEAYRPPGILRRMVAEGKLGKKTGQGFYRWDPE